MTRCGRQPTIAAVASLAAILLTASCNQHAHHNGVAAGTAAPSTSTPTVAPTTSPSYIAPSTVGVAVRTQSTIMSDALFALAAAATHVSGSPFRNVASDLHSALDSGRAAVSAETAAAKNNPPSCTQLRQAVDTVTADLNRAVADTSTVQSLAVGVSSAVARLNAATVVVQHNLAGVIDPATRAGAARAISQARTLATSASSAAQSMVSHAAATEQTLSGLTSRARSLAARHCG